MSDTTCYVSIEAHIGICVLRRYSSAGQDDEVQWLSSENGTGFLPAVSHYLGTKAYGPSSDLSQTRSSTRLGYADLRETEAAGLVGSPRAQAAVRKYS